MLQAITHRHSPHTPPLTQLGDELPVCFFCSLLSLSAPLPAHAPNNIQKCTQTARLMYNRLVTRDSLLDHFETNVFPNSAKPAPTHINEDNVCTKMTLGSHLQHIFVSSCVLMGSKNQAPHQCSISNQSPPGNHPWKWAPPLQAIARKMS